MARTFRTAVSDTPAISHESVNMDCATTDPTDLEEYAATLKELVSYAHNKAAAMRFRIKGDLMTAANLEKICDRIYDELPEWARW